MAKRADAARELIESIMDNEIDMMELIEKQSQRLDVTRGLLQKLARKIFELRRTDKLTSEDARRMFMEGFVASMLLEYAHDVGNIRDTVDKHLDKQIEATREMDAPLSALKPILKDDIKKRIAEKVHAAS